LFYYRKGGGAPYLSKILKTVKAYLLTSDMLLLLMCVAAAVYGIILIYSATLSYKNASYVAVQLASLFIGVGLFFLFSLIDVDSITGKWFLLLIFNVALLSFLLFWGVEGGTGNRSWLRFGPAGLQPSEVIKVTYILLLARQMDHLGIRRGASAPFFFRFSAHTPFCPHVRPDNRDIGGPRLGARFPRDFCVGCLCRRNKTYLFVLGLGACAAAAPWLWNSFLSDYQKKRILAPYFPKTVDPDGLGVTWQTNQSKTALGSGGLFGQGLTRGAQSQSDLLPSKHTDFIFSVAGEELGLIGCTP
jgi:rod shape determining protein RodA